MDGIKGTAGVRVHPGKAEEYKRLSAEAMELDKGQPEALQAVDGFCRIMNRRTLNNRCLVRFYKRL